MNQREKKNIDFLSRVKRIFSPKSTKSEKDFDFETAIATIVDGEGEVMDSDTVQPEKPQRKGGKSKSLGEPSRSQDSVETEGSKERPVQVHRQAATGPTAMRRSLGVASTTGHQQNISHLAQMAQLTIQNDRLNNENQALRHQYSQMLVDAEHPPEPMPRLRYNQTVGSETMESLLLDRELLENLVWRLNVELGRYETRLQQLHKATGTSVYKESSAVAAAPAWCRADPATLAPLLHAYDEALKEKSDLVKTFEQKLQGLGAELREVVHENERLHEALDEMLKKESEVREEAELFQQDVKTLHNENVILLEKLELEKTKNEELSEEYASKMSRMQEQEMLVVQKQAELKTLAREYGVLEKQMVQTQQELEQCIPVKHHNDAISDCRQLLEQLKAKYKEDCQVLEEQNKKLLVEKIAAEAEVRSLTSECAQGEARINALEKLLRRAEARSEQLQTRLVTAESCRDSSVRELRQLMVVAERLTADQEALLQQLQAHQGTNRRLSVLRTSLKCVQKELPEIERQLRAQESGVERLKGDHQREIVRLRALLRHKDQAIKQLQNERNSTCEQLEMAWRATGFESLGAAERDLSQPMSLPETHRKLSPKH